MVDLVVRPVKAQSRPMPEIGPDMTEEIGFSRVGADGDRRTLARAVAVEMPVAIEINGIGYAVLMATPADLHDLVTGFLLTERLIDDGGDLRDFEEIVVAQGRLLRVTVAEACAARLYDRVRHRTSDSSCGLCGVENLEQALRPLPPVRAKSGANDAALFRALDEIEGMQALNRLTRAVHAAAMCADDGAIRLIREDVGRHNAFDKLIGAVALAGLDWDGGFALLTSRCSFELVEKAVLAGCPMLATVSAPTSLALRRADEAGLALRTLARRDAFLEPLPR